MSNNKGGSFAAIPAGTVLVMADKVIAAIEIIRTNRKEKVYAKYVGRKYGWWWDRKVYTREDVESAMKENRFYDDIFDSYEYNNAKDAHWQQCGNAKRLKALAELSIAEYGDKYTIQLTANDLNDLK